MLDTILMFGGVLSVIKYSLETKIKAVNDVLVGGMSVRSAAKLNGIAKSAVHRWVMNYKAQGINGLEAAHGIYSGDFKVHVVEYIHENNVSFARAAAYFGILHDARLRSWDRIYRDKGPQALYNSVSRRYTKVSKDKTNKSDSEKQTEKDLMAEIRRLRMENDYLKKLNALVQAKKESAKKTK